MWKTSNSSNRWGYHRSSIARLSYIDDDDGKALVQAARLIFQDLFNKDKKFKFNFDKDSQKNSVPMSSIMLL